MRSPLLSEPATMHKGKTEHAGMNAVPSNGPRGGITGHEGKQTKIISDCRGQREEVWIQERGARPANVPPPALRMASRSAGVVQDSHVAVAAAQQLCERRDVLHCRAAGGSRWGGAGRVRRAQSVATREHQSLRCAPNTVPAPALTTWLETSTLMSRPQRARHAGQATCEPRGGEQE